MCHEIQPADIAAREAAFKMQQAGLRADPDTSGLIRRWPQLDFDEVCEFI